MKKYILIFVSVFLTLSSSPAHADISPLNAHLVNTCVKIEYAENFPNIYLVGRASLPSPESIEKKYTYYNIESGQCMEAIYKFSSFEILWGEKGNINNQYSLSKKISPNGVWVDNNDVLLKQTITYSLTKLENGDFALQETNRISYPSIYFQYLLPLLMTVFTELLILLILLKILRCRDVKYSKAIITGVVVNVVTFSIYWIVTSEATLNLYRIILWGEIAIFIVEAIAYKIFLKINTIKSITLSVVANLFSILSGTLIYPLALWLFS